MDFLPRAALERAAELAEALWCELLTERGLLATPPSGGPRGASSEFWPRVVPSEGSRAPSEGYPARSLGLESQTSRCPNLPLVPVLAPCRDSEAFAAVLPALEARLAAALAEEPSIVGGLGSASARSATVREWVRHALLAFELVEDALDPF